MRKARTRIGLASLTVAALLIAMGGLGVASTDDAVADRAASARGSLVQHRMRTQQVGCYDDESEDVYNSRSGEPQAFAKADITVWCVSHDTEDITLAVTLAQPTDPGEDPAWNNPLTGAFFDLDVNGDQGADFMAGLVNYRGTPTSIVMRPDGEAMCAADDAFLDDVLFVEFPRECIGSPRLISAMVRFGYDTGATAYVDDSLWGESVSTARDEPVDRLAKRLSGPTRYATAVAVSQELFPSGAPVVYLARADSYADALALGAVSDGPILLVPQCGPVPDFVLEEVRRIAPATVIAAGGQGAICPDVVEQVRTA